MRLVVNKRHSKDMCYNEIALICAQTADSILSPVANINKGMYVIAQRKSRESSLSMLIMSASQILL